MFYRSGISFLPYIFFPTSTAVFRRPRRQQPLRKAADKVVSRDIREPSERLEMVEKGENRRTGFG